MFVNDLAAAKIDTVAEQVSIGLPHPKDKKFRYTMKFVGQVRHDADDQLKKLLLDPPLSRSILIPMPTYGIIQDRNGGPNRAKINVLPFGGACFKEKMIVRGAVLPADHYNIKRLIFVQNKVIAPLVSESCRLLYEAETSYQVRLDADANNREAPSEIRQISLQKALKSRSKLNTIKEIAAEPHKYFTAALRELTFSMCSMRSTKRSTRSRATTRTRWRETVALKLLDASVISAAIWPFWWWMSLWMARCVLS